MDERELANHVLELVDQAAYRQSVGKVLGVHLAIGGRRVIDLERLSSVFDTVARGTVAEGAALNVKILPVRHHCRNCGADFEGTASDLPCPECGHPVTEPIGGEEIRVLEIQVDDAA
ncbi:MAG TPA: hydrogenase maturation nickel metallochaperone HypA [Terriglobales bacterium]|nr:hydrogenase maturation nickel metallochaperone HypA [Terriglobales bacterium]